jgi:cation diffusion facilitator CzcD-associated flavoprotein CzcO
MYTNLWANTPRDVMGFVEKGFPADTPIFPFRTHILQYLREYGDEVKHLVKFNRQVTNVEKHGNKWRVSTVDVRKSSQNETVEEFDAVAVASGTLFHTSSEFQDTMIFL